jgi:hypothetical protein
MKAYGGVDFKINISFTSALVGGELSASCSGRFIAVEKISDTRRIGGWVGPITGLDTVENRKVLTPLGIECQFLWSSKPQTVAIPTALPRLLGFRMVIGFYT